MNSEKTNKTQTIIAFMIPISFGFFIGLLLARYSNPIAIASGDKTITADTKFEEIYVTIQKTGEHIYGLGDTAVRNSHYSKPHTTYQDLCPECSDLWGKKKEGVVEVPVERLAVFRDLSSPSQSGQADSDEPVKTPTTVEELDFILLLLKQQQSHLYTNRYIAEVQYHYLKKHKHPKPGVEGGCPECIALRKKQTTTTEFISRSEHEDLLKREQEANANKPK